MPLLSCTARTCVYNKDEYCSKGDILVEGRSATAADETSCSSFKERSRDTVSDAACYDCGCRTIDVDCKAQECTFNREEKCHAELWRLQKRSDGASGSCARHLKKV